MAGIEWTDRSDWNPVRGCTRVSPGCGGPGDHGGCYAEAMAARFSLSAEELEAKWRADPDNAGKTPPIFKDQWGHGFAEMKGGKPRWTGKVELQQDRLLIPLSWRKPAKVFPDSASDFFHEALSDRDIDQLFAVMALCPHLTFQVLTKRPERMLAYLTSCCRDGINHYMNEIAPQHWCTRELQDYGDLPLKNVWLGTSAERQEEADERIPLLLQTPAAVRFVSLEPLLGPIDLEVAWHGENALDSECWGDCGWCDAGYPPLHNCRHHESIFDGHSGLDWVIVGGESGKDARPMHPDWARSLRDQCQAAGVSFFFKQWGAFATEQTVPIASGARDIPQGAIFGESESVLRNVAYAGHGRSVTLMRRVGKKAAGRLLDGVEHSAFPEVCA